MSDRIILDRIAIFARHGVLPHEEAAGQRFFLSLACELDLREAGRSDELDRTVSYAELAAVAAEVATGRRFRLIEALAEAVAGAILAAFGPVDAVTVRVDKPDAPMPVALGSVAVEIRRTRVGRSAGR